MKVHGVSCKIYELNFLHLCRLSSWTGRGDGDLVEEDEQGEVGSHSQSSISRSLGLMSCSQPACLTQL